MKLYSKTIIRMRFAGDQSNYWTMLHNHLVEGKYPTLLDRIPNCENFHKRYKGCEFDKDNIFEEYIINKSKGGKLMLKCESRGWKTHLHCSLGLVCCAFALFFLLCMAKDIGATSFFFLLSLVLAIANILASNGCQRWAMKKIEDRLDEVSK